MVCSLLGLSCTVDFTEVNRGVTLIAARVANCVAVSSSVGTERLVKCTTTLKPYAVSRVSLLVSLNCVEFKADVLTHLP